jgi:hypothetical protein
LGVDRAANLQSSLFRIEVQLENVPRNLSSGMVAQLRITLSTAGGVSWRLNYLTWVSCSDDRRVSGGVSIDDPCTSARPCPQCIGAAPSISDVVIASVIYVKLPTEASTC